MQYKIILYYITSLLLSIQSTLAYCWPAVQLHFAASSGRSSCPFVNLAAGPAVQLKLTGSSAWRPAGQASRSQAASRLIEVHLHLAVRPADHAKFT